MFYKILAYGPILNSIWLYFGPHINNLKSHATISLW